MVAITEPIMDFLDNDPALKRDISRGLINMNALTKYIIDNVDLDASPESVYTAVKRLIKTKLKQIEQHDNAVLDILKKAKLGTKTDMAALVLKKGDATMDLVQEIMPSIDVRGGDTIWVVRGAESILVVIDNKNLDEVASKFPEDKIKIKMKNISAVTLNMDERVLTTAGVFARVLNEIAIHNINLVETVHCNTEFMLFIEEKDLLKAHQVLYRLCR